MITTKKKLEISQSELELIAHALETQTKILAMQASAGGTGANARLNEVKHLLATLAQEREMQQPKRCRSGLWNALRSGWQTI